MHFFSVSPIVSELITQATHLSQLFYDTHISLWDWNLHIVRGYMV